MKPFISFFFAFLVSNLAFCQFSFIASLEDSSQQKLDFRGTQVIQTLDDGFVATASINFPTDNGTWGGHGDEIGSYVAKLDPMGNKAWDLYLFEPIEIEYPLFISERSDSTFLFLSAFNCGTLFPGFADIKARVISPNGQVLQTMKVGYSQGLICSFMEQGIQPFSKDTVLLASNIGVTKNYGALFSNFGTNHKPGVLVCIGPNRNWIFYETYKNPQTFDEDVVLTHYTSTGTKLRSDTLFFPNYQVLNDIHFAGDHYILSLAEASDSTRYVKIDTSGQIIWHKKHPWHASHTTNTPIGGYLSVEAGHVGKIHKQGLHVYRLDDLGNHTTTDVYVAPDSTYGSETIIARDGMYVTVGAQSCCAWGKSPSKLLVVKQSIPPLPPTAMDKDLTKIWSAHYNFSQQQISWRFQNPGSSKVELLSMQGKILKSIEDQLEGHISTSHFPSGLYFLKGTQNNQQSTQKILLTN